MNPVFNTSSYQGITPPPTEGKENEGTGFAKKPSKSMIEGLRVHLAAKSDTLSIASARQNTGITEAATLSHREIVQEKGMASTTSVTKPAVNKRNHSVNRKLSADWKNRRQP